MIRFMNTLILATIIPFAVFSQDITNEQRKYVTNELISIRRGCMSNAEIESICSMGPGILPIIYDALYMRNDFAKKDSYPYTHQTEALRILAHCKDEQTIPEIIRYINSYVRLNGNKDIQCRQILNCYKTILEISSDNKYKQYVIVNINNLIKANGHGDYNFCLHDGVGPSIYEASINAADKIEIIKHLDFPNTYGMLGLVRLSASRSDELSKAVMSLYLSKKNEIFTRTIAEEVEYQRKHLQDEYNDSENRFQQYLINKRKGVHSGAMAAHPWTDEEIKENHANRKKELEDQIAYLYNAYDLGALYYKAAREFGAKQDAYWVIKMLERSADNGCAMAAERLSICYRQGIGVPRDEQKAAYYKEEAKKAREVSACK